MMEVGPLACNHHTLRVPEVTLGLLEVTLGEWSGIAAQCLSGSLPHLQLLFGGASGDLTP